MLRWLALVLRFAEATLKSRRNLLLENSALRHQLLVLTQNPKRPRWNPLDRTLWVWLSQAWRKWRKGLWLVQPETVIRWHQEGFRLFWKWKSRPLKAGRKAIIPDTITLIRTMSQANPLWGAPRIHGELLKLGVIVAQRTVAKYMTQRAPRPSSQNWKTFLRNHLGHMVSVDLLTVPTLSFQGPYVFIVLSHLRRKVLHFNVTEAPSPRWTANSYAKVFRSPCRPNAFSGIGTPFMA